MGLLCRVSRASTALRLGVGITILITIGTRSTFLACRVLLRRIDQARARARWRDLLLPPLPFINDDFIRDWTTLFAAGPAVELYCQYRR